MNENIIKEIENRSIDRDFFFAYKDRIINTYNYLDSILSNFIDLCCQKFPSFTINKTSYIYGSIKTIALAITFSINKYFNGVCGDPVNYISKTLFPIFMEEYKSEELVSKETQLHILKKTISDYMDIATGVKDYEETKLDSYIGDDIPNVMKFYINELVSYCVDHKNENALITDVVTDVLPKIKSVF